MTARIPLLLLIASCGAPGRTSPEPLSAPTAAPPTAAPPTAASRTDPQADASTAAIPGGDPEGGTQMAGGTVLIGEIASPKTFKPGPTVGRLEPGLLSCYRQVRAAVPSLHGKVKLRVVVNEMGAAQSVAAEPGGSANVPALVSCIAEAFKGTTFPKPGGTAIVLVPIVFRP